MFDTEKPDARRGHEGRKASGPEPLLAGSRWGAKPLRAGGSTTQPLEEAAMLGQERLDAAVGTLEQIVNDLDPAVLEPRFAAKLVETFSKAERICAAGKSLAAGRVSASGVWRTSGESSPAHWMANKTGTSVSRASELLDTASKLASLPGTDKALRAGELSETQAAHIASAAAASPSSEQELLKTAKEQNVTVLKQHCTRVRAAAIPNELSRREAVHRSRYLRTWMEKDGAFRLDGRLTADAGALLMAEVSALKERLAAEGRRQGRPDPFQAYAADALVELAANRGRCSSGPCGTPQDQQSPTGSCGGPHPTPSLEESSGKSHRTKGQEGPSGRSRSGLSLKGSGGGSHGGGQCPDGSSGGSGPALWLDEPLGNRENWESWAGSSAASHPHRCPDGTSGESQRGHCRDGSSVLRHGGRCREGPSIGGPRALVHVRVDYAALKRGETIEGEMCEVRGIGPIPVAAARAFLSDADVSLLLTDGHDIKAVRHLGRSMPSRLKRAVDERDQKCVVPGCSERDRLEIDHTVGVMEGGPTCLDNLGKLCRWHHHLKTYKGYRLSGKPGSWVWESPQCRGAKMPIAPNSATPRLLRA